MKNNSLNSTNIILINKIVKDMCYLPGSTKNITIFNSH